MSIREMNGESKTYESLPQNMRALYSNVSKTLRELKMRSDQMKEGRRKGGRSAERHSERSLTVHTNFIIEW